ncbi:MAG: hypothetical protein IKO42_08070, partial [Opitutales bacterium]|nr:hypothetical protein [Opitutales bacterium]
VRRIKECAKVGGDNFKVLVLMKNSPWPLPWQLIRIEGVKFSSADEDAKNFQDFDIVVFDENFDGVFSGKFSDAEWVEEIFGLRENLLLNARTKRGIFDKSIED